MSRLRDTKWLAELLAMPESSIRSMVHRGQVPHLRLAPRVVRFDEDEINRWLEARRIAAAPPDQLAAARAALAASSAERKGAG